MQISTLKKEHLEQIDKIEKASFSYPWSSNAYLDEISNPLAHYLVVEDSSCVLAYGGFWKILNEGHITNIAVDPKRRKCGIGSFLLTEMLALAKTLEITSLTLEVRASNSAAQALYKKFGFTSCGLRPGYYPDGEAAMIMWLEDL